MVNWDQRSYRMSFTLGGLFINESIDVARLHTPGSSSEDIRRKAPEDQVAVHLVTGPDDGNVAQQCEFLESISTACLGSGVDFTWAFDTSGTAHARDIVTDMGWKIVLDRGLDIFQAPVKSGGFSLGDRLQEHRMAKGF